MNDKDKEIYIRGRGAQSNPHNRFIKNTVVTNLDDLPTEEER